jgi:hypothetical protein
MIAQVLPGYAARLLVVPTGQLLAAGDYVTRQA